EPRATTADVFIPLFDAARRGDYLALATELRRAGFATELYPDAAKLGAQFKYADRRGHRVAVVVGPDEWAQDTLQLKDMKRGESRSVARSELIPALRALLAS